MNRKNQEPKLADLTAADLVENFDGGNRSIPKGQECPDEMVYFDLLEDQSESMPLSDHVKQCLHCQTQIIRLARYMASDNLDEKDHLFLEGKNRELLSDGEDVADDFIKFVITPDQLKLQRCTMAQVSGYRSQDPNVLVLNAKIGGRELRVEFIRSNGNGSQLLIELRGKGNSATFTTEIWKGKDLMREANLKEGIRQAIMKCTKGLYRIHLLADKKVIYRLLVSVA